MTAVNLELARHNMVEQQIRPWEVLDDRVLGLMSVSPREDYVPAAYRNIAYADLAIPLGGGQLMMPPKVVARLLQELTIRPSDKILEVGTGSGYVTSLLASLGAQVYSVEVDAGLSAAAGERLAAHHIRNVTLDVGDGARGWDRHAPYDVILLTGSVPTLAEAHLRHLAPGGRLAAVVGEPPVMQARLYTRTHGGHTVMRSVFETDLPPLAHAATPAEFVF